MKKRLGSKTTTGFFFLERPFFDVDVELKVSRPWEGWAPLCVCVCVLGVLSVLAVLAVHGVLCGVRELGASFLVAMSST